MKIQNKHTFSLPGLKAAKSLICATTVLLGAALPASAVLYDATADFSTTVNGGTNPWSYGLAITGYGPPRAGQLEASYGAIPTWGFAQDGWTGAPNGNSWESWAILSSTQPSIAAIAAGSLMTHGDTSLLFTAPTTGPYAINVTSFFGRDLSRTMLGKFMLNDNQGTPLAQSAFNFGSGVATIYSTPSLALNAGDTLRLDLVGFATAADFVGVGFTAELIPEPTTVALALGSMGVLLLRRRRSVL